MPLCQIWISFTSALFSTLKVKNLLQPNILLANFHRIFIHPTMFLHCSLVICSWTSCSTMLLSASQCINLVLYDISSWAYSFSIFNANFHFHTCFVYAARSADEADQSKQSNLSFSRTVLHSATQTRAHTTQMNIPCLTRKIF